MFLKSKSKANIENERVFNIKDLNNIMHLNRSHACG